MSEVGGTNSGRRVSVTARSIWRNAESLPTDQSQKLEREKDPVETTERFIVLTVVMFFPLQPCCLYIEKRAV